MPPLSCSVSTSPPLMLTLPAPSGGDAKVTAVPALQAKPAPTSVITNLPSFGTLSLGVNVTVIVVVAVLTLFPNSINGCWSPRSYTKAGMATLSSASSDTFAKLTQPYDQRDTLPVKPGAYPVLRPNTLQDTVCVPAIEGF